MSLGIQQGERRMQGDTELNYIWLEATAIHILILAYEFLWYPEL